MIVKMKNGFHNFKFCRRTQDKIIHELIQSCIFQVYYQ